MAAGPVLGIVETRTSEIKVPGYNRNTTTTVENKPLGTSTIQKTTTTVNSSSNVPSISSIAKPYDYTSPVKDTYGGYTPATGNGYT